MSFWNNHCESAISHVTRHARAKATSSRIEKSLDYLRGWTMSYPIQRLDECLKYYGYRYWSCI